MYPNMVKMCSFASTGTVIFFSSLSSINSDKEDIAIISLSIMTCSGLPLRQRATRSTVFILINFVDTQLLKLKFDAFISDILRVCAASLKIHNEWQ